MSSWDPVTGLERYSFFPVESCKPIGVYITLVLVAMIVRYISKPQDFTLSNVLSNLSMLLSCVAILAAVCMYFPGLVWLFVFILILGLLYQLVVWLTTPSSNVPNMYGPSQGNRPQYYPQQDYQQDYERPYSVLGYDESASVLDSYRNN